MVSEEASSCLKWRIETLPPFTLPHVYSFNVYLHLEPQQGSVTIIAFASTISLENSREGKCIVLTNISA